MSIVADGKK